MYFRFHKLAIFEMIELFIFAVLMALSSIGIIFSQQQNLNYNISGLMAKIADLKELIEKNKQALDDFSSQISSLKFKISKLENEKKRMNGRSYELQSRVNNLEYRCSQNYYLNTVSRHFVMNNL